MFQGVCLKTFIMVDYIGAGALFKKILLIVCSPFFFFFFFYVKLFLLLSFQKRNYF
jgi:hypothetical protein